MGRTKKTVVGMVTWALFSAVAVASSGTGSTNPSPGDARTLHSKIDQLIPKVDRLNDDVTRLNTETVPTLRSNVDQLTPIVERLSETVKDLDTTVGEIKVTLAPLAKLPENMEALREKLDELKDDSMGWTLGWYNTVLGVLIGAAGIAFGFLRRPRSD